MKVEIVTLYVALIGEDNEMRVYEDKREAEVMSDAYAKRGGRRIVAEHQALVLDGTAYRLAPFGCEYVPSSVSQRLEAIRDKLTEEELTLIRETQCI